MAGKKSKEAERKKQLAYDMYIAGRPMWEIMEKTGYKKTSIRIFLNQKGVNKRVLLEERKEECIALHKDGKNCSEIARLLSVSPSAVRDNLKKWGYGTKPISEAGCEREPGLEPGVTCLTYADNTKKVGSLVAGGKRYKDITSFYM